MKELFDKIPFWKDLDEYDRQLFLKNAEFRIIPKGTMLAEAGSPCLYFPFVLSGEIRVYRMNEAGKEITLYRIHGGDSCVLTISCLMTGSTFPAYAMTEKTSELFLVPGEIFREWVENIPQWRLYTFRMIEKIIVNMMENVEQIAFQRLEKRLMEFLLERSHKDKDGMIYKTHQEIANELGTAREVISRALKTLERKQMIRVFRGRIQIIDSERLKDIV